MVDRKQTDPSIHDGIISQFKDFSAQAAGHPDFQDFDKDKERLDTMFYSALSGCKEWKHLWKVVCKMLLLSHGQAAVVRGFSVNKEISMKNYPRTLGSSENNNRPCGQTWRCWQGRDDQSTSVQRCQCQVKVQHVS